MVASQGEKTAATVRGRKIKENNKTSPPTGTGTNLLTVRGEVMKAQ